MANGGINEGILDVAVDLAALGVNPLPFLTTKDDVIRSFFFKLHEELLEKKEILDKKLAVAIAEEVRKMFK